MKNAGNNKGVAAVEFAIIAPLLFVLLFGIIEFGVVLYNQAVITNASREGARYAATFYTNPESTAGTLLHCDNIGTYVANYVNARIISLKSSTPFGPGNVSCCDSAVDCSPTTAPSNDFGVPAGRVATIRIGYRYGFLVFGNLIVLVAPGASWSSITLTAQTAMRDENQG